MLPPLNCYCCCCCCRPWAQHSVATCLNASSDQAALMPLLPVLTARPELAPVVGARPLHLPLLQLQTGQAGHTQAGRAAHITTQATGVHACTRHVSMPLPHLGAQPAQPTAPPAPCRTLARTPQKQQPFQAPPASKIFFFLAGCCCCCTPYPKPLPPLRAPLPPPLGLPAPAPLAGPGPAAALPLGLLPPLAAPPPSCSVACLKRPEASTPLKDPVMPCGSTTYISLGVPLKLNTKQDKAERSSAEGRRSRFVGQQL